MHFFGVMFSSSFYAAYKVAKLVMHFKVGKYYFWILKISSISDRNIGFDQSKSASVIRICRSPHKADHVWPYQFLVPMKKYSHGHSLTYGYLISPIKMRSL